MADVTFSLPSEAAFSLVERNLTRMGHAFGLRPSRLLRAILLGDIIVSPNQEAPIVITMEVPDEERDMLQRRIDAWPETHGMGFGEFVLNLALGRYDLREAPRKRDQQKSNGRARPRCRICGRPLKSPEAIAAGIGPVCTARMRQAAAA